jgi:TadE-like protein
LAAVELAVVLPLIVFACMATVDLARVVYALVTLQNCARNGALYEFYKASGFPLPSGWTSLSTAVQADAGNLTVTVPSTWGGIANPYSPQASSNNYVTVTAQCNFTLLTLGSDRGFPSISSTLTLSQSVSMPSQASTGTVP